MQQQIHWGNLGIREWATCVWTGHFPGRAMQLPWLAIVRGPCGTPRQGAARRLPHSWQCTVGCRREGLVCLLRARPPLMAAPHASGCTPAVAFNRAFTASSFSCTSSNRRCSGQIRTTRLLYVQTITLADTIQAVVLVKCSRIIVCACVPQGPRHEPHCLPLLLSKRHLHYELVPLITQRLDLHVEPQ